MKTIAAKGQLNIGYINELQILHLVKRWLMTRLQGNSKNLRNSYGGKNILPLTGEPPLRQVPKVVCSKDGQWLHLR